MWERHPGVHWALWMAGEQGSPNYLAEDFSIRVVRETVQVYTHTPVLLSYLSCKIVFSSSEVVFF